MALAAISLGSNIGDAVANVRRAVEKLSGAGEVTAVSRLYQTKPWGETNQPDFINAAALLETNLDAHALLSKLKLIEKELGRIPSYRWGPRLIDLDLIAYGDKRIDEPNLKLPHPQLYERAFVLIPLAEIDPRYASAAQQIDASGVKLL